MNIENMKNGDYVLLYLEGHDSEFEINVKDGKHIIKRNNYGILTPVKDSEVSLLCDLHTSDDWSKEEHLDLHSIESPYNKTINIRRKNND